MPPREKYCRITRLAGPLLIFVLGGWNSAVGQNPGADVENIFPLAPRELRQRLSEGREIPEWFTFPDVAQELRRTHPPRQKQGFTGGVGDVERKACHCEQIPTSCPWSRALGRGLRRRLLPA